MFNLDLSAEEDYGTHLAPSVLPNTIYARSVGTQPTTFWDGRTIPGFGVFFVFFAWRSAGVLRQQSAKNLTYNSRTQDPRSEV